MLPFLKPKSSPGTTSVINRKSDIPESEKDSEDQGLKSAMKDFMDAVASGSAENAAKAFRAAYEICESYEKSEDYDFGMSNESDSE